MRIFKECLEIEVAEASPSPADSRLHELKKKMMSKFAITSRAAFEMAETKGYVAEIIDEFLSEAGTSSDISLDELSAKFRSSTIPLEPSEFDRYLRYIAETVVAHSTRTSSANFIGHMTTALPDFISPNRRDHEGAESESSEAGDGEGGQLSGASDSGNDAPFDL